MGVLGNIILFTIVETVVLAVWLVLAGLPFTGHYGAVAVLAVGLLVEHTLAYNVGAGKPILSLPKF